MSLSHYDSLFFFFFFFYLFLFILFISVLKGDGCCDQKTRKVFSEQKQITDGERKISSGMTSSGEWFLGFRLDFQLVHFLCTDFPAVIICQNVRNLGALSHSTAAQLAGTVLSVMFLFVIL